jgi:hypothetical protein
VVRALAHSVDDTTLVEIVWGDLHGHFVAGQNANVVLAHFARDVSRDNVSVFQFDTKHGVRQGLNDRAFHFNVFFFRQTLGAYGCVRSGSGRGV